MDASRAGARTIAWSRRRRQALAALAVVTLALAASGCGSSASTGTSKTSPAPASPTTAPSVVAPTPAGAKAAAQTQIKRAYVAFFSGKTGAKTKIGLVEHGAQFAGVIHQQAGGALSKGTSVSVARVSLAAPTATTATVTYTISLNGVPALKNQTGQAVEQGGRWKVAAPTFCSLLTLEGSAPALCKQG